MPSTSSFYDPLYDVVAFQRRSWAKMKAVKDNFQKLIGTYEVNRLNFLKQEGISWLAFPAASYTRFLSALGCWFLSDIALGHVRVEPRSSNGSPWLSEKLIEVGLLEEFRLAALLRNIGTFPFNNTIDNNYRLQNKYREENSIQLRQEIFTVALIQGHRDNEIFKRYTEYLKIKIGKEFDVNRMISKLLRTAEFQDINKDWLVYLIDPDQSMPKPVKLKVDPDQTLFEPGQYHSKDQTLTRERLGKLVRHLIRGLIDIGIMDRTSRASYFICGGGNLFNTQRILHNVLLLLNENEKLEEEIKDGKAGRVKEPQIVLFENGPRDAIDAIYAVQNVFTRNILQDPTRMAYEIMLNHAIDMAFDLPKKNGNQAYFKRYFPFMDDEEFLQIVSEFGNRDIEKIVRRIRFGNSYQCVGRFKVKANDKEFVDSSIDQNQYEKVQHERRDHINNKVKEVCRKEEYLVRFSETFGRPMILNEGQLLAACRGPESQRYAWLDPHKLYTVNRVEDLEEKPEERANKNRKIEKGEHDEKTSLESVKKNEPERMDKSAVVPPRLKELINEHEKQERRTFWLFAPQETKSRKELKGIAKRVAGELDVDYVREW